MVGLELYPCYRLQPATGIRIFFNHHNDTRSNRHKININCNQMFKFVRERHPRNWLVYNSETCIMKLSSIESVCRDVFRLLSYFHE